MKKIYTDQESRNLIATSLDKNYFVIAGAGSGKTTMLVERMVALIEDGANVREICAITFTKKAANEFYSRFHERLIERSDINYKKKEHDLLGDVNEISCKRCLEASLNIDLCYLGTIDAFCNNIISEYPVSAGVPVTSSILEDKKETIKEYKAVFLKVINGEFGNAIKEKAQYFTQLFHKPEDVFLRQIPLFTNKREYKLVYPKIGSKEFTELETDFKNKEKLVKKIFGILKEHKDSMLKVKETGEFFDSYDNLIDDWELSDLQNILKLLKKFIGSYSEEDTPETIQNKKGLRIKEDLYDSLDPEIQDFFRQSKNNKKFDYKLCMPKDDHIVDVIINIIYSYSMDFFDNIKWIVIDELKNRGKLTFADNLIYLRNMLKEDASKIGNEKGLLIKHLQKKYKYFLIDESQDTDPIQSEIFFYLSSSNIEGEWFKNEPIPGSLFIVGDPKQSIYRFKGADISSYFTVADLFDTDVSENLNLNNNFRSCSSLKKYFNNLFKDMFKEDGTIQSKYDLIENDSKKVQTNFNGVFEIKTSSEEEPNDLANVINNLVDNDKYLIFDGSLKKDDNEEKDCYRKIEYKDIMVVPVKKDDLISYQKALYKENIPCFVEGEVKFDETPALKLMKFIFEYIVTESRSSLFGILESGMYSFDVKDLLKFKYDGYDISKYNELSEIVKFKEHIKEKYDVLSPSTILELMLSEIEIFKYISDDNIEQIYNVIELVRSGEISHEFMTHEDVADYLEYLLATTDIERISPLTNSKNYVSLANLHKVKGLEAPIVILLGDQNDKDPSSSFFDKKDDDGKIIEKVGYIFKSAGFMPTAPDFQTTLYKDAKEYEQKFMEAEKIRLLYVAATRAKSALIVMHHQKVDKDTNEVTGGSYYSPLVPACGYVGDIKIQDGEELKIEKAPVEIEKVSALDLYIKEVKSLNKDLEKYTYDTKLPSDIDERKEYRDNETVETKLLTGRDVIGTQVHRMMQLIVESGFEGDSAKIIESMVETDEANIIIEFNKVYETMMNDGFVQEDDCCPIQNLFTYLKDKKCYAEVPFSFKENDTIIYGVIDLIYEDSQGLHIIDYKTNLHKKGLADKYKTQLELYTKAVEEITKEKVVDAYIYHIDI